MQALTVTQPGASDKTQLGPPIPESSPTLTTRHEKPEAAQPQPRVGGPSSARPWIGDCAIPREGLVADMHFLHSRRRGTSPARSEAGKHHLYAVPADQRGPLRPLTREYRRWQRTRAVLVKQFAQLLTFIDQLAEHRLQRWPPPKSDEPRTD